MLTSQDVVSAYRLILGREPESAKIIENYINHSDFDHLRKTLLGSDEFAERLSRDPHLLAVPMAALAMTKEARRYKSLLEALVALALPIWDESVLIIGNEPASLVGFFLDHQCRVSVAASPESARLLRAATLRQAANFSIVPYDFSGPIDDDALERFPVVYGELPDDSSDGMRTWLDNAAEACAGTMIVICEMARGRSEDVFVTPVSRTTTQLKSVPTRKWLYSRLRERFEYIYEPAHFPSEGSYVPTNFVCSDGSLATCVASRKKLSSPGLKEYIASNPSPSQVSRNGSVVATRA